MLGYQNILIFISSLWPIFLILPTYDVFKKNLDYKITLSILLIGGFLAHDVNSLYLRLFSKYKDTSMQNKYTVIGCIIGQLLTINILNNILENKKLSYYSKKSIIITKNLLYLNIFTRLFIILLTKGDLSNISVKNNILWKWGDNRIEKPYKCPFNKLYNNIKDCQIFRTQIIAIIIISLLIITSFKKY